MQGQRGIFVGLRKYGVQIFNGDFAQGHGYKIAKIGGYGVLSQGECNRKSFKILILVSEHVRHRLRNKNCFSRANGVLLPIGTADYSVSFQNNMKFIGYYNYTVILTYMSLISGSLGMKLACDGRLGASIICLAVSGVTFASPAIISSLLSNSG